MKYLYRITNIGNMPHILMHGITHSSSPNADPDYIPIGDTDIITKRKSVVVTTREGQKLVPGLFIPFYFYVRMPMLYNVQHGYNVRPTKPEDIVYMVLAIEPIVSDPKYSIFFSDGHSISKMANFYGRASLPYIDSILDKEAIKTNEWANEYMKSHVWHITEN